MKLSYLIKNQDSKANDNGDKHLSSSPLFS